MNELKQPATIEFENFEKFKTYMHTEVRQKALELVGPTNFDKYIYRYLDEFLECIEHHSINLAEKSIQQEELHEYDDIIDEE